MNRKYSKKAIISEIKESVQNYLVSEKTTIERLGIEEKLDMIKNNPEFANKIPYVVSNVMKNLNDHSSYCKQNVIPYIQATGKKYYKVILDMYRTPYNLTTDGEKVIKYALYSEFLQNLEHIKIDSQNPYTTNITAEIYPIKKDRLKEFCTKLFYLSIVYRDFINDNYKRLYDEHKRRKD